MGYKSKTFQDDERGNILKELINPSETAEQQATSYANRHDLDIDHMDRNTDGSLRVVFSKDD